jgi:ribosomal protein S18 acetylase RimI-like enzyme
MLNFIHFIADSFRIRMKIYIKPLSADLLEDYLFFFDRMEFKENPDWSKCYCYSFHFTGPPETWQKEQNRSAVSKLIRKNDLKGYLAYYGKKPVGWCNVNDRKSFQRLSQTYKLEDPGPDKIASVVCFVIHPEYRNQGIAGMLLERIIEDYSSGLYDYLEAYPANHETSCERNYKGPFRLYQKKGFFVVRSYDGYSIVRKSLK